MPVEKRTYSDQEWCPVARTLDIVGDRWTLLVLRDIMLRKRKFNEIQEGLGCSPNLLADRLKRLEAEGLVERRFYSDHPPRAEYRLTEKGKAFSYVVAAMRDFGEKWIPSDAEPPHGYKTTAT